MQLTENILFVSLSFGLPKQQRQVKAQSDVDADRVRAAGKLYTGNAFAAIKSHDLATRAGLQRLAIAVPSALRNTYVLPARVASDADTYLQDRAEERRALVETFLSESYEVERERARAAFNGQFRERDFPPVDMVRRYFTSTWTVFAMDVPEGLPDSIRDAEIAKFRDMMDAAALECRAALRQTMADLVGHLADRLAPDADGKRKRLTTTTVTNLRDFLDSVDRRDITSDAEIRALATRARAVIGEYSKDDLKGAWTGSKVREGLAEVKTSLDSLIKRDGGRRIDLDLE